MTGVRIGSKGSPLDELLEAFKREDSKQMALGDFPMDSQWVDFGRCLNLPPDLFNTLLTQIQRGNKERYYAIKTIMIYWSEKNTCMANLGTILSIVERNFKWEIVTEFLRKKIQTHAKCFDDLDEGSKKKLMNLQFVCLGRQTSLNSIQDLVSKETFTEIINTIDNSFIVEVLQNNLRQFDEFQLPPVSSHYINRSVEVKRKLNPKIFQKECEDIFIFESTLPENLNLSILVRPNPADVSGGQLDHLTARFILLESEDHVTKISAKTTKPVHRIEYKDNCYFWIRSFRSISVIREFLSQEVEEISEENLIDEMLSDFNSKSLAICGGPGTGKSLLLTSLANQVYKKYPERITMLMGFPQLIGQQAFLENILESTDQAVRLADLFGSVFTMHKFARTILEGLMKNQKVHFEIFLDKIDEVQLGHFSQAKHILKMLLYYPNMRIHLTISPTVRLELENHLEIISSDIVPFRNDEMTSLLSKMVNSHVRQLVLKSVELIRKKDNLHKKTAGSPLQCYMLAEVYSKSTTKKYDVSGEIPWSKCPIKSLTELYSRFMEVKFKEIGNQNMKLFKLHCYRNVFIKFFRDNPKANRIMQELDKQVCEFTMPSKYFDAEFEHKTFSEYLLAEFILENWKESSIVKKTTLCTFLYTTLLATCKTEESDELAETFDDLENDTLKSVLMENLMGAENSCQKNAAITRMMKLGWNRILKHLQTSVLKGQLAFRYSVVCYFLNDMFSNDESSTIKDFSQGSLKVCQNSDANFDLISKDFVSKLLVSVSFSYTNLFWITAEVFRETTGTKDSYINLQTYQTILILAARQGDVENFKYFHKLVGSNDDTCITSIRFDCQILKNMVYEHTPLHEAAKRGNHKLFEHLFDIYRNKMQALTGLVQICLSDSSRHCKHIIKNKSKILRLLSSENVKYHFKSIECSLLDGVHVTLFTKGCDMVGYTLSGKDVKWLYKFVVCYFTSYEQMDIFVNWLISKGLTRLLLYVEEGNNNLVIDALRQNVLGPQSLENIYTSYKFDLGSVMYYVKHCNNRHALVIKMIDLSGDVSLTDDNDPTILQWATSMYDCDPMKYAHFERSDKENMGQRLAKHKRSQVKILFDEIRKIIKESQSISVVEQIGQIQYNSNDILGKGRFGVVYSGTLNERRVAVKKIDFTPEQEEQVVQETELLRECDGHENIVKCFFVEKSSCTMLIALEICNFTLEQVVKADHLALTEVQIRQLLSEMAKGIEFIHSRHVVHLGITPQNVLIAGVFDVGVRVKIGDFGNSRKLTDKKETKFEDGPGTMEWMAPEFSANKQSFVQTVSTSADIFSLGCVFYYVLSNGKHPFGDQSAAIISNIQLNSPCVDIRDLKQPTFIHLFCLMTNKNPDLRPTAAALLHHHIFWPEKTMLSFLVSVSNAADTPTVTSEISKIMERIENYSMLKPYYEPTNSRGWIRFLCRDVQAYVSGIGCKRKAYHGDLFFDLVRAIRNMQAHYIALPENVQRAVGEVPNLFMRYWLKQFVIIFEIIWLNFEDLKNNSSSALSEYYCKDYNFNCEDVRKQADKILAKFIKKQCAHMVLKGSFL